jgi:hypothetical protein
MATITINGAMTLDESAGLQNSGVATATEDNNDSDVSLSTLQTDASSFYTRLFTGLALDSSFATANGVARSASNFISVSSGGSSITALGFVDGSGAALPVYGVASDGVATNLVAVDGGAIELYVDSASGLGNRMVLGVDQDGDIVFAAYMAPNGGLTAATVWMVQFEAMANPNTGSHDESVDLFDSIGVGVSSTTDFNFNNLPSGSNLFGMIGTASSAVIVIGAAPVLKGDGTYTNASDVIHTSQGGGPVTIGVDNQMFDPGDGAYFTFVTNPDPRYLGGAPDGLNPTEADDSDNILFGERLEVTGGNLTVSQTQGNGAIALKLTLFNQTEGAGDLVDGRPFVTSGLGAGSHVAVTGITVRNALGADVTGSVSITLNGDGSATVSGLASGYKVLWTGAGVHDQILVEGVSGKFDIGGMGINQPSSTSIDIGDQLNFEDDGPDATLDLKAGAEVRVDESLGANAGENEVGSLGSVTVAAAVLFDKTTAFGQDGQGASAQAWSLVLSSAGADSGLDDSATGSNILLYNDGNDIVGRVGSAAGAIDFRIAINATTGAVTLTQYAGMKHGDSTDPDEADTPLSLSAALVAARLTITDGDGDSDHDDADIGPAMKFEDDGPDATLDLKLGAEVRVDESLGEHPGEDESGSLGSVTVAAAVLFDKTTAFGQDGQGASALAYSLVLGTAGADSGLDDTATGSNILLYNDGADIVGRVGSAAGAIDFRVAINATTGALTLTQYAGMSHGDATDPDEADTPLSLAASLVAARLTITDGDGDSDYDDADIGPALIFEDDGPSVGPIDDGLVDFAPGDSVTNSLNGDIGSDPNDNPYTITAYTGTVTAGETELHGVINGDATQVSYWADTSGNGTFGDAGDTEFYRLSLDQAGAGAYTFEVLTAPQPPKVFLFDDLPSGQNLFGVIGDADDGLLVIGQFPILKSAGNDSYSNASNTISTSQGGTGATIGVNNQMFDPGDGAYFTFVNDPDPRYLSGIPGGLDQNEADRAGNIQFDGRTEVDGAYLVISQIQANSSPALKLKAFDGNDSLEGRAFVEGGGLGGGTTPAITQIIVKNAGGTIVQTINAPVADGGGFYNVTGLDAGYRVEWTTAAPHDQVLVVGVSGKFDIGEFGTLQAAEVPDQLLEFTVQAVDGDGDPFSSSFSIGIDGTGIYDDDAVGGVSALTFAPQLEAQNDLSVALLGRVWLADEPLF